MTTGRAPNNSVQAEPNGSEYEQTQKKANISDTQAKHLGNGGQMLFTPDEQEKTVNIPIHVRDGQIHFYFDGPMPE